MFGICNLSLVPVRKEASDKSEMVTQLLFGEHFEVLEKSKQWRKICIAYDGYKGWIDEKQFESISVEEYNHLNLNESKVAVDIAEVISTDSLLFPLVIGSQLPNYHENNCSIGKFKFQYDGQVRDLNAFASKHQLVENAYMYLNAPYLWGGRSPFGIDCSGFTQLVYKLSGIKLKRDAYQQAEQGQTLNFITEAEMGDLAFFDNTEGKIIHVGIILPENKIIHASGKVRVDLIDHEGIFNTDTKSYSHKLRLIKRLF
jgi:hypothetical protein